MGRGRENVKTRELKVQRPWDGRENGEFETMRYRWARNSVIEGENRCYMNKNSS